MKSDLLNSRLQNVFLGLKSEEADDDEKEAEESDIEITTDGGMHEVVDSDGKGDVLEGFVDRDM